MATSFDELELGDIEHDDLVALATGAGAPHVGDVPVSLDMMPALLGVEENTPYTWAHRGVLPPHDGVCGRSRWWWKSNILGWHAVRQTTGGRPRTRTPAAA